MNNQTPCTLVEHFSCITDPRVDRTKRHKLIDILVISICATICGADGWEEFETFGHAKFEWLNTFLELPHGIPSDDTFRRVIGRNDPGQFQQCFLEWVRSVSEITRGQIIAVDGKFSRGSGDRRVMPQLWGEELFWRNKPALTVGLATFHCVSVAQA